MSTQLDLMAQHERYEKYYNQFRAEACNMQTDAHHSIKSNKQKPKKELNTSTTEE